jgi:hypothetical protein
MKALAAPAQEDRRAEFEFKLLDPVRQALRSVAKMPLLGHCDKITKLPNEHVRRLQREHSRPGNRTV